MNAEAPRQVRLADYRAPAFLVDAIALDFTLSPQATRVAARLSLRRTGEPGAALVLNGARLKTLGLAIDGRPLAADAYQLTDELLTIPAVPDTFTLETEVEIDPAGNTALEGLYMSGGRFYTQCEAEGFRRITWFPDRPDVLARYRVRIEAPETYGHLLSNGNLVEQGAAGPGRHFAVWEDPFPKPCYLFALVAGDLDMVADRFTTASGRGIDLRLYVDPGQGQRVAYAMDSLKRSMRWDEDAYGREYDLDLFMIVAVRDFNMGAMENKGLNIFNSSLLLADPATATDFDYERIESVVAHEYFHNWTGNRITCRDWFQLCVKEGLTVFRDQSFSADQRGEPVQRIKDVRALRARQFPEDAGPLAHPARPEVYQKIDNFYTATVYEKGAEICRLLKTLVGPADFRRAMDLYFERFDGQAVTVEDFLSCFAEVTGRDMAGVLAWYRQAGTPKVTASPTWNAAERTLSLTLRQAIGPTPGQAEKQPLPIPVRLGLLDEDGRVQSFAAAGATVEETTLVLDTAEATVRLEGVAQPPVLSVLRGFSAPVVLTLDEPGEHRFTRLAHDPDLFNRFEAGQGLARDLILAGAAGNGDAAGEARYAAALGRALADQGAEPGFKALLLSLPGEQELALARTPADPEAIHSAREHLRRVIADKLRPQLEALHDALAPAGPFSPDADSAGRRALRNGVLDLLAAAAGPADLARAASHAADAADMTQALGGLSALMLIGGPAFETALAEFYHRWQDEPLVVDKWFALQARDPSAQALERVTRLLDHPAFDRRTPNRFRALVASFAQGNPRRFHAPDGSGYRFLANEILKVDLINPQVAARQLEPLGGWRRYRPDLGALMKAELERIAGFPGLSRNVAELAGKALAD
ncbi:aminopeptidase N [Zavarzinia compransoris]|uniref:Aminopeptidase N n=1 Tax=Zavarzinia compransoris TaxID=1264899 RepID=A0A317DW14_9PROT|nr:aminopeptidase N [Zavarzinia compransoris]PWR18879.1 aminopeptidase N [Zavarzinia compransoris]TDP48874.1 aminopeptidase N [Zavarzinia compransoris]